MGGGEGGVGGGEEGRRGRRKKGKLVISSGESNTLIIGILNKERKWRERICKRNDIR